MSKIKKYLPLAMLAVIPIAYHKLHPSQPSSSDQMLPLPETLIPTNDFYIPEEDYAQVMDEVVQPYLKAREEIATFHTSHCINYGYYKADRSTATVVISHGYAETLGRYAEVIYYFLKMGYDVYLPEHFGHGDSEAGVTDPAVVWVDDFNEYTFDFHYFIKTVVRPKNPTQPIIGYGHSMGGAILARALEQYPGLCNAAIFSSPMFRVFLVQSESLLFPLIQGLAKTSLNKSALPIETPLEHLKFKDFKPEKVAMHSLPRALYFHDLRIHADKPARWAVSWGWIYEAINGTHQIVKPQNVEKIQIPLMMFQSETDWFVDPRGMFQFAKTAKNLTFYKVPGSYHEIYSETNDIMVPYFNTINQFINNFIELNPTIKI